MIFLRSITRTTHGVNAVNGLTAPAYASVSRVKL